VIPKTQPKLEMTKEPALAPTSGYFFEHCNPIHAGGHTEDAAMAAELWRVSEQLTAGYLMQAPPPERQS